VCVCVLSFGFGLDIYKLPQLFFFVVFDALTGTVDDADIDAGGLYVDNDTTGCVCAFVCVCVLVGADACAGMIM